MSQELFSKYPEITKPEKLLEFYTDAKFFCMQYDEFVHDINWQNSRSFESIDSAEFYWEYVWVVLCSGFSVKASRNIIDKLKSDPTNFSLVRHPLKRKAIEYAFQHHFTWLQQLKECDTDNSKLLLLETFSFIGPITKYHLAKNIGLQVAKPDVHLARVAERFCSKTNAISLVQKLCEFISKSTGDKVPTVDLILWRWCEQHRGYYNESDWK